MYQISELWIYPVKSLRGIKLEEANCESRGLRHDRRWLIVNKENQFISQRSHPKMALLQPAIFERNGQIDLEISEFANESHKFVIQNASLINEDVPAIQVKVWDDEVLAQVVIGEVNDYLSSYLEDTVKLVYMPNESKRAVEQKYAISGNEITSFSDAYPYLILGEAAIDHLNKKLEKPVDSRRFRPNIVFKGGQAHDEDTWSHFMINNINFYGVKPCARCPIPNINPDTSLSDKEPIKTLSTYRFKNNKVYFGQNVLISDQLGSIAVGNTIEVLNS